MLSEMFSTLWLSDMLFLFMPYSFFRALSAINSLRIVNGQNNMSGEKSGKLDTLAKLFQPMRSRNKY